MAGCVVNRKPEEEHRRFTRVQFPAVVILRIDGNQYECAVIDISLKGALLSRPNSWQTTSNQNVDLEVRIADDIRIKMQGVVAHIEADRVGVSCTHMDLDSAAHLRRLVEFNLGNEEQLHRELQALILPK
jgi:hypothetical protein